MHASERTLRLLARFSVSALAAGAAAFVAGVALTPAPEEPDRFRWTDKNRWE